MQRLGTNMCFSWLKLGEREKWEVGMGGRERLRWDRSSIRSHQFLNCANLDFSRFEGWIGLSYIGDECSG